MAMKPVVKYSLIGIFVVMLINAYIEKTSPSAVAATATRNEIGLAEAVCQLDFEKNAKDPDSVEWIRQEREFAWVSEDKTKALSKQPVRAKNSFNATIRSVVMCELKKDGNQWQVIKLSEKQ